MPKRCQSLGQWELGRVRIHPVVATGNKNKDRSHGKAWEERHESRSKWPTAMQTNLSIKVNFEHLVNVQVVLPGHFSHQGLSLCQDPPCSSHLSSARQLGSLSRLDFEYVGNVEGSCLHLITPPMDRDTLTLSPFFTPLLMKRAPLDTCHLKRLPLSLRRKTQPLKVSTCKPLLCSSSPR